MSGEQTIFRAHRQERDRWTPLLNDTIRDSRMSFRATGLLVVLLSLPPDWKANQQHIASLKTEGRDAVVTAWNELRKLGYIDKELQREKGKIVATIWNIYETPCRLTEKPETVEPETVEPETAQPKTGNPPLQRIEGNKRQKKQNAADAATVSICFGEFWEAYPRHTGSKKKCEQKFIAKKLFDKIEVLLDAIEKQKQTDQWKSGFIPHPETWLNNNRWEDELSHDEKRTAGNRGAGKAGPQNRNTGTANEGAESQYAGLGRVPGV